jgi:hypothetical protein
MLGYRPWLWFLTKMESADCDVILNEDHLRIKTKVTVEIDHWNANSDHIF